MRLQQVLSVVKPLMQLLVLLPEVIRSQNHCPTHGVDLKLKEVARLNFGFKKGELFFKKDLNFHFVMFEAFFEKTVGPFLFLFIAFLI